VIRENYPAVLSRTQKAELLWKILIDGIPVFEDAGFSVTLNKGKGLLLKKGHGVQRIWIAPADGFRNAKHWDIFLSFGWKNLGSGLATIDLSGRTLQKREDDELLSLLVNHLRRNGIRLN
jgi:hypothetical protein